LSADDHDVVERSIELAVATAIESVALMLAA
jgi:hypothetical protein